MLTLNTGVTFHDPDHSTPGLILFSPIGGSAVYLVDYQGRIAHQWSVGTGFTNWCYLLPNGNLFINERCENRKGVALTGSGLMREYDWNSNIVWEHQDLYQHHDARRLANGGTAYLAFSELSAEEQSLVRGGIPGSETEPGIFGETIREIDKTGKVVWEWNFTQLQPDQFPLHPNANRWSRAHTNTIEPLADGNYLISCRALNLIFIIDRQTQKIKWHYQNNQMGGQHDSQMLDTGNILLFANGTFSPDLHHSQVWELNPKTEEIVWRYRPKDNPQGFYSPHIGGCQRLPSGNTLVCEGAKGCLFEVNPQGEVVWEYVSPFFNPNPTFGQINWVYRARHYQAGGPEIQNRIE